MNPEAMTAEERQQEVAGILAQALLRQLAQVGQLCSPIPEAKRVSKTSLNSLDVSAKTRLSVSQRPAC